jgi:PPK2 family polyphosphate:nucleotide phosphotransferase
MKTKDIIKNARKLAVPFRISNGEKFRLKDIDPGDTLHFGSEDKPRAKEALAIGVEALAELQDKLYAQDRWSVLLIFQAMDAAGKDGTIKHVMSGVNPQGVQVFSFKAPSAEELDHDFLWRSLRALPPQGRTGVFSRSYYEDVLVVKMCPEVLAAAKVPGSLVGKHVWDERYEDIRAVEGHLARSGTAIRRFFHPVASGAQKRRFLERLNSPEIRWPFDLADLDTRDRWGNYMRAYEEAIHDTLADAEPGAVVPPDERWFTRLVVAAVVVHALQSLGQRSCAGRATLAGPREA